MTQTNRSSAPFQLEPFAPSHPTHSSSQLFPVALENPLAFSTALSHELKSGGAVAHRSQPPLSHTFHQLLPAQVIQLNQLEMLYGKHLVEEVT